MEKRPIFKPSPAGTSEVQILSRLADQRNVSRCTCAHYMEPIWSNLNQVGLRTPLRPLSYLAGTQDWVLGKIQPSPFDKLRAGSAGLPCPEPLPSTTCWARFSRPYGTGSDTLWGFGFFLAGGRHMTDQNGKFGRD